MKFKEYYTNLNPEIKEYFKILTPVFPKFLIPFIETKTMMRLKDVGYFCGMDYGNQNIYNFKYYLSTLDHSISTALIVWDKTYNEYETLAALFHDAGSPALRHVIDYLNNDHINQESTEKDLLEVFKQDNELMRLIKVLNYDINKIIDFKRYPLVDSSRPKLCADRLDGIFLSCLVWIQNTNLEEVKRLYENIITRKNEDNQEEFSFIDIIEADTLVELNNEFDKYTQRDDDYFSMMTLANIVNLLINNNIIIYDDLYTLTDKDIFDIINKSLYIDEINTLYNSFLNESSNPNIIRFKTKKRTIDPLILSLRYSEY